MAFLMMLRRLNFDVTAHGFRSAFSDWAQMDAFPSNLRTAIEATVREKARAYESSGMLIIPNPSILVSAAK